MGRGHVQRLAAGAPAAQRRGPVDALESVAGLERTDAGQVRPVAASARSVRADDAAGDRQRVTDREPLAVRDDLHRAGRSRRPAGRTGPARPRRSPARTRPRRATSARPPPATRPGPTCRRPAAMTAVARPAAPHPLPRDERHGERVGGRRRVHAHPRPRSPGPRAGCSPPDVPAPSGRRRPAGPVARRARSAAAARARADRAGAAPPRRTAGRHRRRHTPRGPASAATGRAASVTTRGRRRRAGSGRARAPSARCRCSRRHASTPRA